MQDDSPAPAPKDPTPAKPPGSPPTAETTTPATTLTPEEQMALFEKELKETDWGHQPC